MRGRDGGRRGGGEGRRASRRTALAAVEDGTGDAGDEHEEVGDDRDAEDEHQVLRLFELDVAQPRVRRDDDVREPARGGEQHNHEPAYALAVEVLEAGEATHGAEHLQKAAAAAAAPRVVVAVTGQPVAYTPKRGSRAWGGGGR